MHPAPFRLAQLSPAEREFLCAAVSSDDVFLSTLAGRLAAVLGARMNQHIEVRISGSVAATHAGQPDHPQLDWDAGLDDMWLRGRLGSVSGAFRHSTAMRARLERTLALTLAEVWFSHPDGSLPVRVSLLIHTGGQQAGLNIIFPATRSAMNRWTRQTIHHVE